MLYFSCAASADVPSSKEKSVDAAPSVALQDKGAVDLGEIAAGDKVTKEVSISNGGGATLYLTQIYTDCSCIAASCEADSILPGDSAAIRIRYNTKGHRPGKFLNVVKLKTNAPERVTRLYVTGRILEK